MTGRAVVVAVALVLLGTVLLARAPRAHAEPCPLFQSQADQISRTGECRLSMLVDTGVDELMSLDELREHASYYESLGFAPGLADRAVAAELTFHRGDGRTWTACERVDRDGPCPTDKLREGFVMSAFVPDTVTLDVFLDPAAPDQFIARSCGNTGSLADAEKRAIRLVDPPSRLEIHQPTPVQVVGTLVNAGPADVVTVEDVFTVEAPDDCTVDPERRVVRHELRLGVPVDVDAAFTITCHERSDHPFTFRNDVRIVGKTTERNPGNNTASVPWTVEVFEPVDLSVDLVRLRCGERGFGPATFPCTAAVTVTNHGPADAVATRTTVTLAGPADCTTSPSGAHVDVRRLAGGETAVVEAPWSMTCLAMQRHSFLATARVSVAEPHAEDTDPGNDAGRRAWLPLDIKPRSDPSSINIGKQGVVPVAILSTPELDAVAEVDTGTLRFGATGFEDSLVGCGDPEDVNDDGLLDVVCRFDGRQALLTCGATEATMTGFLRDGTPFEGQDTIKVTGC